MMTLIQARDICRSRARQYGYRSIQEEYKQMADALDAAIREREAIQAKAGAMMLEYCPDEMTPAQKAEWAKHQAPTPAAMAKESGNG